MYYYYTCISAINKKYSHQSEKKHNGNKNNKKHSIKIKEDIGMSKPKKHVNKVGRLT